MARYSERWWWCGSLAGRVTQSNAAVFCLWPRGIFHFDVWHKFVPLSPIIVAVAVGTLLLALAQAALLGMSWRWVAPLIVLVLGLWYAHLALVSSRIFRMELWAMIVLWQILYLVLTAPALMANVRKGRQT